MYTKTEIEIKLDAEIQSALNQLKQIPDKTSEEYSKLTERIAKLHQLKNNESENTIKVEETLHKFALDSKFKRPSTDTMLIVAANIFGILWLARYERENVIKSRSALGFVMRPNR